MRRSSSSVPEKYQGRPEETEKKNPREVKEMTGFKTLEKKYGVKVVSEGYYYNDRTGRMVETFKMYSADGCCWEKGLSRKGVKAECEEWSVALLEIKNKGYGR